MGIKLIFLARTYALKIGGNFSRSTSRSTKEDDEGLRSRLSADQSIGSTLTTAVLPFQTLAGVGTALALALAGASNVQALALAKADESSSETFLFFGTPGWINEITRDNNDLTFESSEF